MTKILKLSDSEIIDLYNSGLSSIKISKLAECSDSTIREHLKKNNIALKSNKEYRTTQKFNENYFHFIDTEDKAYWLGFMYADGNLTKTRNQYKIQLRVNDKEVIEKFIKSINGNISVKEYSYPNRKTYYGIFLTSEKMFNDLKFHGCVPNKSLVLTFPITIPNYLKRHFIRGYFDGDGCVCISNKKWTKTPKTNPIICYNKTIIIDICGTKEFLTELSKIGKFSIGKDKRRPTNCWYLRSNDKNKIKKFYYYLYLHSTVYLERKKKLFEDFYQNDVQRL